MKQELRKGYTTGTCAAIATKAAIKMLLTGEKVSKESVMTPKGILIETDIYDMVSDSFSCSCAVKKDGGDDPDFTSGLLIYSKVSLKKEAGIEIDGGIGVGRVTRKGLWQEVGEAAINKVPRQMIMQAVTEQVEIHNYKGGVSVLIYVPEGEKIAEKTFNPRLGIVGGISILGTSGIVEPMSEKALIDSIKAEINYRLVNNDAYLMLAPGNYGIDFIRETYGKDLDKAVKCSNYVGEALDYAKEKGAKGILMIGHVGKFCKLAGGIMNTHSHNADSRMEIIASNTAKVTDDINLVRQILDCITTDQALSIIDDAGILKPVMQHILSRALFYVRERTEKKVQIEMIIFSNQFGILAGSENVDRLFEKIKD